MSRVRPKCYICTMDSELTASERNVIERYRLADNVIVATVTGETNDECEAKAEATQYNTMIMDGVTTITD